MANKLNITQAELKNKLEYNSEGYLVWINSNKRYLNKKAGYADSQTGYRLINFDKTMHFEHRLIYLYHFGYVLKIIDHINSNRRDNRIENLRESNSFLNSINSKKQQKAKTPYKGVSKAGNKYRTWINIEGSQIHLGTYFCIEDAAMVYNEIMVEWAGDYAKLNEWCPVYVNPMTEKIKAIAITEEEEII